MGANGFATKERARATGWKAASGTLPEAARCPAGYVDKNGVETSTRYRFCLPPAHAGLSLLPEVRVRALQLFVDLGIPWHAGIDGGPSNHLLSSQVQCVNALGQMVDDPERLKRAFAGILGTIDVLEIEPGRSLTFEYIGPVDYFNESLGGDRVRGAMCTSVDAAFLHRTSDRTELVLIEWKYTESYSSRRVEPAKDATRWARYGKALTAEDSPVRADVLTFDDLLDEPLYQLMRQQLLAHELEKDRVLGADRVRIVHVAPKANTAYQQSLQRPAQRAVGETVTDVWNRLLRRSDRFYSLDSAIFLDPAITSDEYTARYGPSNDSL